MASSVRPREAVHRYPPLASALLALLLAAFVLPSALNVPQSNPTQTLEFAPIPPEDDQPPPAEVGNLESLSLGSSSTAPAGDAPGGSGPGLPSIVPDGVGERPVTKRCVGVPPRQTEDALSPPCVAHFEGDNGGATYLGVGEHEIRILVYLDGTTTAGPESDGNEAALRDQCYDLGKPPAGPESITPKYMRAFQRYFNDRYQTYDRTARFVVCFASESSNATPETRRADATRHLADFDPFAVVMSQIRYGLISEYAEVIAGAGRLVFGSAAGAQPASFFRSHPGRIWSFLPSVEEQARLYASYVCQKVVGRPVVDSGNEGENGGPRRFGWLSTTDQGKANLLLFKQVAREQIEGCGVQFEAEGTFPNSGQITQSQGDDPAASYAAANMATFAQRGVTTILWPGGYEADHGKAASQIEYHPEVIVAGDGIHDGTSGGLYQDQDFWAHAWVQTQQVLVDRNADPCREALKEGDPGAAPRDMTRVCSFPYYQDFRQLFTGIQVAGPKLTVETLDRGFHAIPGVPSDDPKVAACFYNPGDYTCVKDSTSAWWDTETTAPGQTLPGCWKMVEGGRRYVADAWDDGNIDARAGTTDPCNAYNQAPLVF